jgi:ferrous iron transport protein B
MGNPNVGKSVLFSRLTGANVIASNYPGTTVEFSEGLMHINGKDVRVIDVPGVYSLCADCRAEEVASKMLHEQIKASGSLVIINVIDSTNLERNLGLSLQLIKAQAPMLIAMNMWDETKHTGIEIDIGKLQEKLSLKAIPTCALSGEGVKDLVGAVTEATVPRFSYEEEEKWKTIGQLVEEFQSIHHKHHKPAEFLEDLTVRPLSGLIIAAIAAVFSFLMIRMIGEGIINYLADPFFEGIMTPVLMKLSSLLGPGGWMHDILIGKLIDGQIVFMESLGLLTTGLYVPLAAVVPYIIAFYFILSFLEDSGYMPRLAVLLDTSMHRIGLHGYGIIPMILGFGCNVPGALATRLMETRRERFLAGTIMAITIPCMAQIAMISGLIGRYGWRGFLPVFLTLFLVWLILGLMLNRFMKGHAPELFIEIPPYRLPSWRALMKKILMRIRWFLSEAIPWVLVGVFLVNIMYSLGIIGKISAWTGPFISGVMGLPGEAAAAMVVGFLRKDVAVGMLVPLGMSLKQLIIASVVLTMYFPCVATFTVMMKEFGLYDMFRSAAIMIAATVLTAFMLNIIL